MTKYNIKKRLLALVMTIFCVSLLVSCKKDDVKQNENIKEDVEVSAVITDGKIKFKGGEKDPEELRLKFLEALDNRDYETFMNCIVNDDITEEVFNAFVNELDSSGGGRSGMETNLRGSVSVWETAERYGEDEPHNNDYFPIVKSNNRYRINIFDGKITLKDLYPGMKVTIKETGEALRADEYGEVEISLFPGKYNYTLSLDSKDEIGSGSFNLESMSNYTTSLKHDYKSSDIPEDSNEALKKAPKVSNLFLGSWKNEAGNYEMTFHNTYDYHHYETADHYENSGTGSMRMKLDGLSYSCDFEIISDSKINVQVLSQLSTVNYRFENGVLWFDGDKFIRQSN